ncbi:MAG TPA: YlxR family protein [Roseiflexaceae bacterium]|nr:YlxR family protein [Roseiflexaceae bacterium]
MAQTPKKHKGGPRPKHVPQRLCIACRRTGAKRGLVRLVRDGEGRVAVDATGKRAGRGAYLCHDPACWEQALKRHALERALRIEALHPEDRAALEAQAQLLHKEGSGEGQTIP